MSRGTKQSDAPLAPELAVLRDSDEEKKSRDA
jgi:hypothetical protein